MEFCGPIPAKAPRRSTHIPHEAATMRKMALARRMFFRIAMVMVFPLHVLMLTPLTLSGEPPWRSTAA